MKRINDDKLSSEIVNKSFKTVGIILELDGSDEEMLICHYLLLKDNELMAEQDEEMKDAEIDDNSNNS